jgi:hypothetical protein
LGHGSGEVLADIGDEAPRAPCRDTKTRRHEGEKAKYRIQNTGDRRQETGDRRQETSGDRGIMRTGDQVIAGLGTVGQFENAKIKVQNEKLGNPEVVGMGVFNVLVQLRKSW